MASLQKDRHRTRHTEFSRADGSPVVCASKRDRGETLSQLGGLWERPTIAMTSDSAALSNRVSRG